MKAVVNARALYEAARFLRVAVLEALEKHGKVKSLPNLRLTFSKTRLVINALTDVARVEVELPLVGGDVESKTIRHTNVVSFWEIVRDLPRAKKVETEIGLPDPADEPNCLQFANTKYGGCVDENCPALVGWICGAYWQVTECFVCDFRKVWKAASLDEVRGWIRSVALYGGAVVATDGHRLYRSLKPLHLAGKSANIPLGIVKALVMNGSARVTVSVDCRPNDKKNSFPAKERNWQVMLHTDEFTARLEGASVGTFPRYYEVIPKTKRAGTLHAKRKDLFQALRTAVRQAGDAALCWNLGASGLKARDVDMLVCGGTYAGNTTENKKSTVTGLFKWNGPAGVLGIRAAYLLDALEQCEGEYVVIEVYPATFDKGQGVVDPIVINEGNFQAVIMPMRV